VLEIESNNNIKTYLIITLSEEKTKIAYKIEHTNQKQNVNKDKR